MKEEDKTSREIESGISLSVWDNEKNCFVSHVCSEEYLKVLSDNERKDKEIKEKAREILRLKWKNRALNNLWSTTCNKQERENKELKKQLSAKDQEIAELKLKLNKV